MKTNTLMSASFKTLVAGAWMVLAPHCPAAHQPFDARAWEQAGQGGAVNAVATSPDGVWLASGSDDATVKIWRTSDGTLARTLAAAGLLQVTALAFGPGSTSIAAGYADGSIRLWNTTNGALVRTIEVVWARSPATNTFTNYLGKVVSLAFSPNGQQLASGGGDWFTRIWRVSDGANLYSNILFGGVVLSVAYSPDGTKLVVAGEDTNVIKKIVVLNPSNWSVPLATLYQGSNSVTAGSNSVTSLAFSPGGDILASGCLDRTIYFWQTSGWGLNRTLTNAGPGVTALAFGANGQTLFSGDESGAITLRAASASPSWSATQSWLAHTGGVWSLACSADYNKLASGGDDHRIKLWRTTDGVALANLVSHAGMITRTCFAPDGSMVASASMDGSLRLWGAVSGASSTALTIHTNQISAMAFSPDSTLLATGGGCLDNTIRIWSCTNGSLLRTIAATTNGVTALAISPVTNLVASAGDRSEQAIKLWSVADGTLAQAFAGHTNGTGVLAFSPNGQFLASGGMFNSGTIKMWNMTSRTLAQTYTGHTCTVQSISFNMNGSLLASAGKKDALIKIWQTSDGTLVRSLTNLTKSLAFSPDGTLLAAAGSNTIQMWRTSNWQPVWSCTNETVGISSLGFSPNGTFLVFGRDDGTVGRIWNPQAAPVSLTLSIAQAGQLTITNPSYSPFLSVQVSSDPAGWGLAGVLTNVVAATNLVRVTDPSPQPMRFYRVSTPE